MYFYIDTDDATVDQEQVTNWYKSVQFPQELEDARAVKAKKIDVEINNTKK